MSSDFLDALRSAPVPISPLQIPQSRRRGTWCRCGSCWSTCARRTSANECKNTDSTSPNSSRWVTHDVCTDLIEVPVQDTKWVLGPCSSPNSCVCIIHHSAHEYRLKRIHSKMKKAALSKFQYRNSITERVRYQEIVPRKWHEIVVQKSCMNFKSKKIRIKQCNQKIQYQWVQWVVGNQKARRAERCVKQRAMNQWYHIQEQAE